MQFQTAVNTAFTWNGSSGFNLAQHNTHTTTTVECFIPLQLHLCVGCAARCQSHTHPHSFCTTKLSMLGVWFGDRIST